MHKPDDEDLPLPASVNKENTEEISLCFVVFEQYNIS